MRHAEHVLYLAPKRVLAFRLDADGVTQLRSFDAAAMDSDYQAFVASLVDTTTLVLLDIVEEEYVVDGIPKVRGGNRTALMRRRLEHHFGGKPYRTAVHQGPNAANPRQDRLLLALLTNHEAVAQWLAPIVTKGVPLLGVTSVPFVQQALFAALGAAEEQVLVVSCQQKEFVRQTLFVAGQLTISRLSRIDRYGRDGANDLEIIAEQLERGRGYYAQVGLLQPAAALTVVWLGSEAEQRLLAEHLADTHGIAVRVGDYCETLGRRTGLIVDASRTEGLYAHCAGHMKPPANYARPEQLASFQRRRTRRRGKAGLWSAATVLLAAGTLIGADLLAARAANDRLDATLAATETAIAFEKDLIVESRLTASEVRSAVTLASALDRRRIDVTELLAAIGRAMDRHPGILLDSLTWTSIAADTAVAAAPGPTAKSVAVTLRGTVAPSNVTIPAAFRVVRAFMGELADAPEVIRVTAVSLPARIAIDETLSGEAAQGQSTSNGGFELDVKLEFGRDT